MQTTLILCIHNHQPVGNLPDVFARAYRDAYLPFLEALERFPQIKLVLHNTGPLLEWYEENAPEYIERVRALVERGQVEILTGAFYEPILSAIPARDAAGQIAKMNEYVSSTFGTKARGMWLAERVWESCHAKTIAGAGVEYVPLDDYEFRLAGIDDDDLTGYFVTEDQGVPLSLFPISKRLRYAIPFREPEESIAILRELAERGPGLAAVFGDDGEKFGVWPGTHSHVYSGRWLDRFFTALAENSDWLTTSTFSEFVDTTPARGRAYLPTSSYPEMMEWALPTPARRRHERLTRELEQQDAADEWRPFLSGGIWKGFLTKYDEANVMARKMFRVSEKVASQLRTIDVLRSDGVLSDDGRGEDGGADPPVDAAAVHEARNELWRGQCNCAYWHGVFGGLYLPHLRSAIYKHLIRAENLLDASRGTTWNSMEIIDHDLDGEDEVLLESHWANLYAAPARGGTLFELDLRRAETNILATMSRYDEAYHHAVDETAAAEEDDEDGVPTIHGSMRAKESGLEQLAGRDRRPRRSSIDRFLAKGTGCEAARRGDAADLGDFVDARYGFELRQGEGSVGVIMSRRGTVRGDDGPAGVILEKSAWLAPDDTVRVDYVLTAEDDLDALFAPEWNLAFLTPNTDYVYLTRGDSEAGDSERKSLARRANHRDADGLSITDLLGGEVVSISLEPASDIWTWPLETASQSEGGVERVFQGVTITTSWPVVLKAGERASFSLALRARPAEE